MSDLDVNEEDLLSRIHEKEVLRRLFFKKAKGLKWFDSLDQAGYFQPENLPAPEPSREEGYITIPRWEVLDYLVKTAPELVGDKAEEYAPRFLQIVRAATEHAREQDFGNYHAWWQFSELLSRLPHRFIAPEALDVVDYWLDDKFETGLVAEVLGEQWLPALLEKDDEHALSLAKALASILYRVRFVEREMAGRSRREATLRFSWYWAEIITRKVAFLAGRRLGYDAVCLFHSRLTDVLGELKNDAWSSIWQPAIEEHDQNKYHEDAENILVAGYRNCLNGYVDVEPVEAEKHLLDLLNSGLQTVKRIAIYCINKHPWHYRHLWDRLIDDAFLEPNYRHEVWHFLRDNYGDFSSAQKETLQALIQAKVRKDDDGTVLEGATAYERSGWLAAIKDHGQNELRLYHKAASLAKTEPDHPDFSSYISSGSVTPESPYSAEELSSMAIDDLAHLLATFEGGGGWREPGIEGLSKAFRQLLVSRPIDYFETLDRLTELDLAYVHAAIDAYSELWREKAKLPWDDIWERLLSFIFTVIQKERFWEPVTAKRRQQFLANRHWVVRAIGRLLEAGTKSDDHAFHEKHLEHAESILKLMLNKEAGEEFNEDSDPVSIAISSPRGQCIEALINLTLRACRLEDKKTGGQHVAAWAHFQPYYDAELKRPAMGEYEFATLVTNYLPNFLYMSTAWVVENLAQIFDQADYIKWLCAMNGYSYVNTVHAELYIHLRDEGHLVRALDDVNLKERAEDRFVQHIAVAFLNNFESLADENSLIAALMERDDFDELSHLIWFVWTLRNDNDEALKHKVYELWPELMKVIDLASKEGQKLASALCLWAFFADRIDDRNKGWLLAVAPYAHVSHNSYEFLRSLARASETQPFEANEIWQEMLRGTVMDYPEEAIRKILANLMSQGEAGKRAARETVSAYLERGVERPSIWLKEIATAD